MTVPGFRRKEFRGKLAIAITANFKNMRTTAEAVVDEISGVAFVYKQDFFNNLYEEFGIALENIVYYKVKRSWQLFWVIFHLDIFRTIISETTFLVRHDLFDNILFFGNVVAGRNAGGNRCAASGGI